MVRVKGVKLVDTFLHLLMLIPKESETYIILA